LESWVYWACQPPNEFRAFPGWTTSSVVGRPVDDDVGPRAGWRPNLRNFRPEKAKTERARAVLGGRVGAELFA